MAGDWIKIEHATPDKEEISHLAELLNLDEDRIMGILLRVWIWADQTSTDGKLGPSGMRAINRKAGVENFAEKLLETGWLKAKNDGVCFPKFNRHNGNPAKKRALAWRRKRAQRSRECHAASVTKTGLEEKREESKQKKKKPPTPLVDLFAKYPDLDTPEFRAAWALWEVHRGELNKKLTPSGVKQQFKKLAEIGPQRAVAAIERSIANEWTGIHEANQNANRQATKTGPGQLPPPSEHGGKTRQLDL